jgi:NAD(P)H-quinone oxidoreductase subunit 5
MNFTELTCAGKVRAMNLHPLNPSTLFAWQALLLLAPALLAAAAALFARHRSGTAAVWRGARWATSAGLGLAALSLVATVYTGSAVGFGLRADTIGGAVMLLVAFVGWVIVRYSQPYLNGERDERRYVRWLLAALAAVSTVIAANHVLLLALAWMTTSMAMHRLLNFFGDRPAAVVAAHKKFIAARAADLCMLGAAALLASAFGTLQIDQIDQIVDLAANNVTNGASSGLALPLAAQAATLLIAVAALLKCAQLPFHGWLIQVMEAPTPVSALLHAGVVNLGGFVLIRFAPLVSEVPAAQILLVAVGASTAVLAALVMTTRISIKVMLAWSTCAQMGFMLMQCGLGAWEMALLHLLAHSLYKAHAFLGAGGTVRQAMLRQMTPLPHAPTAVTLAIGAAVGLGMTAVAAAAWSLLYPQQSISPVIWVLAGIVSLALVPLVNGRAFQLGGSRLLALMLGAFAVAFTYLGLHLLFAKWVGHATGTPPAWLLLFVVVAFSLLFLMQCLITIAPHSTTLRRLYPWFYGGLFLDEKLTRFLFSIWPPPQPLAAAQPLPVIESLSTGARP